MLKPVTLALMASLPLSSMALAQGAPAAAPRPATAPEKAPHSAHCTITKAFACKADGACAPTSEIGRVRLPLKVTLDFQNRVMMTVAADGFPVSSRISTLLGADKQLIAQGIDDGVGWIFHGSGRDMTASLAMASNHTVLSAFGACELDLNE